MIASGSDRAGASLQRDFRLATGSATWQLAPCRLFSWESLIQSVLVMSKVKRSRAVMPQVLRCYMVSLGNG
jgi:hypothetical protein